jgi:hypothetical protein
MLNLKSNGLILHEVINPKNPLVAIVPPSAKLLDDLNIKSVLGSWVPSE